MDWPGKYVCFLTENQARNFHMILDYSSNNFCRLHSYMSMVKYTKDKGNILKIKSPFKNYLRASLVAQWLRICLPMQGTRVRALVREDPTCRRVTKPVCHNYWACALDPSSHDYWARVPQLPRPVHLEPVLCNKRSHGNEEPVHGNEE